MPHVAVVLAAGKSTRMKSRLPKAAHSIAGRPLLAHVLAATAAAIGSDEGSSEAGDPPPGDAEDDSSRIVVVLGHEAGLVESALRGVPGLPAFRVAHQTEQLGTGDAVRAARDMLGGRRLDDASAVLVLYGDTPLVRAETLKTLLWQHARARATVTFLTGETDQPTGYGRVMRDATGRVAGIVEEKHANDHQKRITEVNSGVYSFDADWLWSRLDHLKVHPSGEYYLTDLVDVAVAEDRTIATVSAPLSEAMGVNDRIQLAEAGAILRRRILDELMLSGVTIVDPSSTFIDVGVRVGQDTTIQPFTTLRGDVFIGEQCTIGPHSVIRDSVVGDHCSVIGSWIEEATLAADVHVGPMSHLRPGANLASGVHIGNYAEVKNARIGEFVQQHHFSYIGDATVGAFSNIGAGVVTANWDGEHKHHTEVGEAVFLSCDTTLVAPVTLGEGALTGAGAVVNHDVPPSGVAVGIPARVIRRRESPLKKRRSSHASPASLAPDAQAVSSPEDRDAGSEPASGDAQHTARASEPAPGSESPSPRTSQGAHGAQGGGEGKELRLDG